MLDLKTEARRILFATLKQVDVRVAVSHNLQIKGSHLLTAQSSFALEAIHKIIVVVVGKAASPMYEATMQALQPARPFVESFHAIVISPRRPAEAYGHFRFFHGAHPTPAEISRQAAIAVLELLHTADANTIVLFLISGGSSSMMELPLDSAIPLHDVAEFNRILVGSGLPIQQMNLLRKHLSAVKGGRLAQAAALAAQCTLILSDVPGHSLDTVGSGPSLPDSNCTEDRLRIYRKLRTTQRLPASIERFFEVDFPLETPKPTDPAFRRATWTSILSSDHLASAASAIAATAGFHVEVDNTCDDWPIEDAADYLLRRSAHLKTLHRRSCLISVGEIGVELTGTVGQGGRNQHFVLQCALKLAESGADITVLSAGSDGIDGNSVAAGAIADRHTCNRAVSAGINPVQALASFNSFPLFQTLEDAIITGPTGNNLRDLRLFLA